MQKAKLYVQRAAVAVGSLALAGSAFAADDYGITAINALSGTATTYIAAAFAVAIVVTGGFWSIRMARKSFGAAK